MDRFKGLKYLFIFLLSVALADDYLWDSRTMRISLRHIEAKGIGYPNGYTSLTGFFAPNSQNFLVVPFLDIRGHIFDDGKLAANAGVGLRGIVGCRILGANVYYDFRNTKRQDYSQIGVGLEVLAPSWEARLNGYLPIGDKISKVYDVDTSNYCFHTFNGNNLVMQQTITSKIQFAMRGVNAELGYHFLSNKNFDILLAGGPYYFEFEKKHALGGEVRVAINLSQYVTLEGMASYDNRFREIAQGQISINIPFGPRVHFKSNQFDRCCNECLLGRRIVQDVARQEIIVADRMDKIHKINKPAINPTTNQPYYFIFVDNTSHSEGTFESPYPTLAEAQKVSRSGDIIYVMPGDGTQSGLNAGIVLQDNQKLWGAGVEHKLTTAEGSVIVPVQSDVNSEVSNISGDVVTLANNNEISGLLIRSTVGHGISSTVPITNATISNNTLHGSIQLIDPQGTIEIKDNVILEAGITILATQVENAKYVIADNQYSSNSNFFVGTYTDCSDVSTVLTNNYLTSFGGPTILNFNNSTPAKTVNQVTICNNTAYSDIASSTAILQCNTQNFANVIATIKDNVFYTPNVNGCMIALTENSQIDFTYDNNTSCSLSDVNIALSQAATLKSILTNNHLLGGIHLVASDSSSLPSLAINDNIMQNAGVYLETLGSTRIIGTIANNDIQSGFNGVDLIAKENSVQNIVLSNNTLLQLQNYGFQLSTNNASQGFWNVTENTFIGTSAGAILAISNDTSTTCLSFNNNLSTTGTFQFTNSGGVFNMEPMNKNTGLISESGTITHDQRCLE